MKGDIKCPYCKGAGTASVILLSEQNIPVPVECEFSAGIYGRKAKLMHEGCRTPEQVESSRHWETFEEGMGN